MFRNADERFKKDISAERAALVGPGSYDQEGGAIGRKSTAIKGKVSSAFASTSLRDGFLGA